MSTVNPALVGASALLPAFVNLSMENLKETKNSKTDLTENHIEVQKETTDFQRETVARDFKDGYERPKKPTKQPPKPVIKNNGKPTTNLSEKQTAKEMVAMSAFSLLGDKILLDYKHAEANVGGKTEKVFRTNAPRPKLNHHDSVSESRNVTPATGLYRTIVGEVPRFLTIKDGEEETSSDSSRSSDASPDEVFVSEEEGGSENITEYSMPRERNNNDNPPMKHSPIQRTLSKFRRQKQYLTSRTTKISRNITIILFVKRKVMSVVLRF